MDRNTQGFPLETMKLEPPGAEGSLKENHDCNSNGNFSKQKVYWGEQKLCTCIIILGTFLCRPLQNNNVKWPNSALCRERERRRLFLLNFYFEFIAVSNNPGQK